MKKLPFSGVGLFLSLALTMVLNSACRQTYTLATTASAIPDQPAAPMHVLPAAATGPELPEPRHVVNIKAVRHFVKNYPGIENEKWYRINKGFMAKCEVKGNKTRVDYDPRGQWLYTIRYYEVGRFPENIRVLVKSNYYDYTITLIEEIEAPGHAPVYIAHLHHQPYWKQVRVVNGEMEEVPLKN